MAANDLFSNDPVARKKDSGAARLQPKQMYHHSLVTGWRLGDRRKPWDVSPQVQDKLGFRDLITIVDAKNSNTLSSHRELDKAGYSLRSVQNQTGRAFSIGDEQLVQRGLRAKSSAMANLSSFFQNQFPQRVGARALARSGRLRAFWSSVAG